MSLFSHLSSALYTPLIRSARGVVWLMARIARQKHTVRGERGMALMWAMIVFAVLSITVVNFLNDTRVNYALAVNQADGTKAYFNARSSVELQKLGLLFQNELEKDPFLGTMVTSSNFQVWEVMNLILPIISTGELDTDFGNVQLRDEDIVFEGDYTRNGSMKFNRPTPEEGKINLNAFASQKVDEDLLRRFCNMIAPPLWDHMRSLTETRTLEQKFQVIANIIDYVDPDDNETIIDGHCKVSQGSSGGEAHHYRELDYLPKNQPLTTLNELRLVPGVTEGFMERFGNELTVYPIADNALYINQANATALMGFLCSHFQGGGNGSGYSPCDTPQTAYEVSRIALALDGYIKFFQNPLNVLSFYMGDMGGIGSGDGRLAAGMALGQMQAFRRPQQLQTIITAIMSNPQFELFFIRRADRVVATDFGLDEAIRTAEESFLTPFTILPNQFDYQTMSANISTSTPKVFMLEAEGSSQNITRHIRTVVDVSDEKPVTLYWREF